MDLSDRSDIAATALLAGSALADIRKLGDGTEVVLVPDGFNLAATEEYLLKPRYVRQITAHRTLDSFMAYMNGHRTENSAIFADVQNTVIVGVIDFHSKKNEAENGAHRAIYDVPVSEEWKRWTEFQGKWHSQGDFAVFLEENQIDVVNPTGAEMLEIALTLEAKKSGYFKSGLRLQDGSHQLEYTDEVKASAGGSAGKLTIPSEIEIGIPVFYRGLLFKMKAFFRYRINDGKLVLRLDLHRIKETRDAAFDKIIDTIRGVEGGVEAGVPDVSVYEGALK